MTDDSIRNDQRPPGHWPKHRMTIWIKICVVVLLFLIALRILGLQVIVQVEYDDKPVMAALSEIETYYLPLGLLLIYFAATWLWDLFIGAGKED